MGKTMYFWRPRPKQRDNSAADKLLIKLRSDSGHPKYPCGLMNPCCNVQAFPRVSPKHGHTKHDCL